MTQAPSHPPVHSYEGENPWELIPSPYGVMEGELGGLTELSKQIYNDTATKIADVEERERTVIEREQACDARERAHAVSITRFVDFVGQAASLFDRIEKLRADQQEEPLASPPGHKSEEPEPSLAPEDTVQPAHGDPPGDPVTTDQEEFPTGELPTPPVTAQPVSPGLDAEEFEEEKHGD